jgi:hypothetical protein
MDNHRYLMDDLSHQIPRITVLSKIADNRIFPFMFSLCDKK